MSLLAQLPRRITGVFLAAALAASASAQVYRLTGGTTSLTFNNAALDSFGVEIAGSAGTTSAAPGYSFGFGVNPGLTTFQFTSSLDLWSGAVAHLGSLTFRDKTSGDDFQIGNFGLAYSIGRESATASGFYLLDTLGGYGPLFDIGQLDDASFNGSELWAGPASLLIAPELNTLLQDFEFTTSDVTGMVVGSGFFTGNAALVEAAFTPVPEPSTYGLVAGASLLGLLVWRRRSGRSASLA